MRRLNDGVFAMLAAEGEESWLESLDGGRLATIPAADTDELARLAHGVPDEEPESALFRRLAGEGLAAEGLAPIDPLVLSRLERLGRGFSWTLSGQPEGERLASLLRRAHARRKGFVQAFGQTPCLPESAARRCLVVRERVPEGARVMLLGDDDLVGLGLAALGYDVTSVDIDPLLIAFLARVSDEEGLSLRARVLDLLAPLPEGDVGAYDAVLTDPMSYESCMLAFVSRALSLVKPGGLVFTCVNPVGRDTWRRVLPRLPARVVETRALLSAYYYDRYIENAYRSDLVTLERGDGDTAFSPTKTIPFSAITEGRLSEHEHAHVLARGMRSKAKGAVDVATLSSALVSALGGAPFAGFTSEDGRYTYAAVARGGGLACASFDNARTTLSLSCFPGERAEVHAALDGALSSLMRTLKREGWFVASLRVPPRPLSDERSSELS